MSLSSDPSPSTLAQLVPDEPRWIDLRGLLLTGRCDLGVEAGPDLGFIARSWDFPFASLYGDPGPELILAATAAGRTAFEGRSTGDDWQLLAPPENRGLVESALPGWQRRGIILHRWEGSLASVEPPSDIEIRLLPDGHRAADLSFDRFPEATRREQALEWVSGQPMVTAVADSRPVAYCYSAFTTEALWDVAIETAEPYRRRGLAAACFLSLAAHIAEQGKTPTWGAMEDNPGSLGLAATLGFVRDASLDGWSLDQGKARAS